jgi:hypothetical protein
MKLLFILILLPFLAHSQYEKLKVANFRFPGVDSTAKLIKLPVLSQAQYEVLQDFGRYSSYVNYVRSDTLYYRLFQRYHPDSLPLIDFSKNELILTTACHQCIAYCNDEGQNTPCHRNVCSYTFIWYLKGRVSR